MGVKWITDSTKLDWYETTHGAANSAPRWTKQEVVDLLNTDVGELLHHALQHTLKRTPPTEGIHHDRQGQAHGAHA